MGMGFNLRTLIVLAIIVAVLYSVFYATSKRYRKR
jgi:hypothetical protein